MASIQHDAGEVVCLGTRKSKLAMIQCNLVLDILSQAFPDLTFPIRTVVVRGDADKKTPFLLMNEKEGAAWQANLAKSLWTEEMEAQLLAGQLDILVHSLKDLATTLCAGTTLGAFLRREDPRDALVMKKGSPYKELSDLPFGSVVGTSSTRRKSLLTRLYPHLVVEECRGNVDTRLAKLDNPDGPLSCIILASAGLHRMGLDHRISSFLSPKHWPYAVGQGAIGIQIREGDPRAIKTSLALDDRETRLQCLAERALLRTLQGGCSSPVGVYSYMYSAEVYDTKGGDWQSMRTASMMRLSGTVIHPHGWSEVSCNEKAEVNSEQEAEDLGIRVAEVMLKSGAADILTSIRNIAAAGISKHFQQTEELEALQSEKHK